MVEAGLAALIQNPDVPSLRTVSFLFPFVILFLLPQIGEVSEWLKEHAWKVCILERVSRVRIPPSPQIRLDPESADN